MNAKFRIVLSFTVVILSSLVVHGQHCPFDNSGLIVVKLTKNKSNEQSKQLKPVLTYFNDEHKPIRMEFALNRVKLYDSLKKPNFYDVSTLYFDFAKNYFVASIPMNKIDKSYIQLENEKGQVVGEKHLITKNKVFDLHENFGSNWVKFKGNYTPKPLHKFKHLLVINT